MSEDYIKNKLPKNWSEATLGDVTLYIQRGKSPKYISLSELPVINQKSIRWDGIQPEHLKYIHPDQQSEWSEIRYVKDLDILWNSTGTGTIGRACLFKQSDDLPQAVVDSHVTIVRLCKEYANPSYAFYYIKSFFVQRKIEEMQSGSTNQVELGRAAIIETKFPFPPLAEQHRIVDKIEELFSDLDAGIESLKTARSQLRIYRQAVLKWAFEGKLTADWRQEQQRKGKLKSADELLAQIKIDREQHYQQQLKDWDAAVKAWESNGKADKKPTKPQKLKIVEPLSKNEINELSELPYGWKWIKFGELISSIRGGTTAVPIDTPTCYPILRSSSVRDSKIDYSDVRFLAANQITSQNDFVSVNDLLFTRLNGTVEYVGNCAIVTEKLSTILLYPDRLYCAKLINPSLAYYVEKAFASPILRRWIESKAKSTAGHKRISISDIVEIPFPFSNSSESEIAILELEEKLSIIGSLELTITENLQRAESLRQSVLKQAFEGKLVPQDPNDEPAAQLLERIKQAKAAPQQPQQLEIPLPSTTSRRKPKPA